jgi:zinc protease
MRSPILLLRGLLLACLSLSLPVLAAIPIQHWTLPSGVQVYLVESPSIAMVDMQIDFDAGSRRDPADKAGLASVTAGMASRGVLAAPGETALDENGLSEAWADLGASFGASATGDRMSFSLRSLTYPDLLGKAMALAARQLGQPAFPQTIWLRERERLTASLREARTRPATIAGRAFAAAVYGAHPYGYEMTEQTLSRIGVTDMQSLYARAIQPCRAKVSIVGAVTRVQAQELLGVLFSRLPAGAAGCTVLPPVPEVAPLDKPADLRIAADSAQAHVLMGQPAEGPSMELLTLQQEQELCKWAKTGRRWCCAWRISCATV